MTTNQTIDGVPREAFKWALKQLEEDGNKGCGYFDSLRALLDAPAAQHQGETVAYRYMDCNTGTYGPTKCGGIYYAEIPEYGRSWEVTTKSHGAVLIERKQNAIANGFVDSHPSLTVIIEPLYAEQPAPVAQKYDDTLLPFLGLMRKELHANSGKGDRERWLGMDTGAALTEIYHHFDKLAEAVSARDMPQIAEYAADVANCAMMLADVCGVLGRA